MVKIIIFEAPDAISLEHQVNEYLKTNNLRADNIVKIDYNKLLTYHENMGVKDYNSFSYSVMIVIDNWRDNTTMREAVAVAPIPDGGIEGL